MACPTEKEHMMTRIGTLLMFAASLLPAQPKPAITPADYGKWETMSQTVLSPDGKWLAAPIKRTNGTSELRIHPMAGGQAFVAPSGTEPAFSANSRWAAYAIGYTEAEEDKLKKAKKPVQLKLGIMDLTTGAAVTIDDVASFAFSDRIAISHSAATLR
jgi:hypothetical protein